MSKIVEANEKIAEKVVGGYKKIENGVVGGYTKMQDTIVGAAGQVMDKSMQSLFGKEGETVEETRERLKNGGR